MKSIIFICFLSFFVSINSKVIYTEECSYYDPNNQSKCEIHSVEILECLTKRTLFIPCPGNHTYIEYNVKYTPDFASNLLYYNFYHVNGTVKTALLSQPVICGVDACVAVPGSQQTLPLYWYIPKNLFEIPDPLLIEHKIWNDVGEECCFATWLLFGYHGV